MRNFFISLFFAVSLCAQAQTRIAVLTDTHVMAPELLKSDGTAWQSYLASDRKLVDYSQRLFDTMVDRIRKDIRPDLVLITGDISKDGEVLSHQYVVSKLDILRSAGIPTLVIPGNHDLGTSNAKVYNGDNATSAEVATASSFASLYANYGYGDASLRDPNSLSYVTEPFNGLVIVGIDSSKNGVVSSSTLSWITSQVALAKEKGKQIIAMMHHPLFPHFSGVESFVNTSVVADYETVRNALADAGVRVILTGHFHTSDIARDFNHDLSESIIDINTGSLISYPCDYRVLTISKDRQTLAVSTGSVSSLDGVDDFSAIAKERLVTAVKKQVAAKGTAYSFIAPTVATAFVCHAEGDEHENATAQSTLNSLLSLASMATMMGMSSSEVSSMTDMANSMLRDISQYNTDRANQTDDRSINLQLDAVTESVTIGAPGYASFSCKRRIDFSKTSGLNAYIVSGMTASQVSLQKITSAPANTGLILQGTPNTTYTLYPTSEDIDAFSENILQSVYSPVSPSGALVLSIKSGAVGFYPLSPGVTIPKGKSYIPNN